MHSCGEIVDSLLQANFEISAMYTIHFFCSKVLSQNHQNHIDFNHFFKISSKISSISPTAKFQFCQKFSRQQFSVDAVNCLDFLEVYKGVLPEFNDIATEMSSGPILAMEIRQKDCVGQLRKLVGPHDPEIAQHLRPDTLRAKYTSNSNNYVFL